MANERLRNPDYGDLETESCDELHEFADDAREFVAGLESGQEQRHIMYGIDWPRYQAFAEALGETHNRLTYDHGTLEFMTLSFEHESWSKILGRLVETLTEELDRPLKSAGSTTFNREDVERGLESDQCYYLDNEPLVRDKSKLDLATDPPPDLAIEVEISRSAINRMDIYASLRIPEVWRFNGKTLTIHQLTDKGEYVVVDRSLHFPFLPMDELQRFLMLRGQVSETQLIKSFRQWVREQIARNWQPPAK